MKGRVLIIAGSDSGGGAGIQADLKTVTCLGGYAMTAVTALTAQNTEGVFAIHDVPPAFVSEQIRRVVDDIGVDVIKIGMLHRADVVEIVAETLQALAPCVPLVVDPVMLAKGGASLLQAAAVEALRRWLVPRASLLTPNLPEARILASGGGDGVALATAVLELGPAAVLLKGGHGEGPVLSDILVQNGIDAKTFQSRRIDASHTHGTGCTLASAIATGLAQNMDMTAAVERGRAYVIEAIRTAPGFGRGHGPLNHAHPLAGASIP